MLEPATSAHSSFAHVILIRLRSQNSTEYDAKDAYANGNGAYQSDDRKPLTQSSNQARSSTQNRIRSKTSIEGAAQQYQDDGEEPMDMNGDYPDGTAANGSAQTSSNNRKRVASRERSRVRRKGSRGAVSVMNEAVPEGEESSWIHRDKLAQIESRELAALGLRLGGKSSRTGSRRAKSTKTDKSVVEADDFVHDEMPDEDPATVESRKLREIADEDANQSRYHNHSADIDSFAQSVGQRNDSRPGTARSGASRIPVPTGSYDDDESPVSLSHKRSASFSRTRQQRSQSQGSRDLLENKNDKNGPSSPTTASKPNNRVVSGNGKSRKPSTARKASNGGLQDGTRSRSNSTTDSPKRPGTSGGRPTTARPEGDPPWMSTMYKPDPRLPPDQQMLPTHARRMAEMQRQAEEDSHGRAREREDEEEYTLVEPEEQPVPEKRNTVVGPVQVEPVKQEPARPTERESIQKARNSYQQNRASYQRASDMSDKPEATQWPLRTPSGHVVNPAQDRSAAASPTKQQQQQSNDGSASPEHGGYNLMPNVSSPVASPKPEQARASQRVSHRSTNSVQLSELTEKERQANQAMAPVNQPVRLQEPETSKEDEQKKKGCLGCCVVM